MTRSTTADTEPIWRAIAAERANLADLLAGLPDAAWQHPSLCADWRVRDVVAHLVLSANPTLGQIVVNLIRAGGNLNRLICDTALRHAARRTDAELLAELRETVGAHVTALGSTPADRLMDVLVHSQDIAIPLGVAHDVPVESARTAVTRIWEQDKPFHARATYRGYRLRATDIEWSGGEGEVVEGPIAALLLLLTGRDAASDRLTGPGAARLGAQRGLR